MIRDDLEGRQTIQHLQSEDQYTGKLRIGRRQVSLSKAAK